MFLIERDGTERPICRECRRAYTPGPRTIAFYVKNWPHVRIVCPECQAKQVRPETLRTRRTAPRAS